MEDFGNWSIITTNFLIILYMALGGVVFSALLELVGGKWRFQVRHLACANMALFPIAFVLLLILLANGEATFPWLAEMRKGDTNFPGWHNYTFLVFREICGFLITFLIYLAFVFYQRESEVDKSPKTLFRFRIITILVPFVYVIYGTMVSWDFEMTLEAGWHSSSYAVYHFQSNFHGFLAYFTLMMFVLDKTGRLKDMFEPKIYNYMAQYMLGMTIMWIYFYFTQYLVFWYGRLPNDMDRYIRMMEGGYIFFFVIFLLFKFFIPFCMLIFTPCRHSRGIIVAMAIFILTGTWLERYIWISGSVSSRFYHTPLSDSFDLLVTAIIAIAAFFALRWALLRYKLLTSRV